MHWWIQSFLPRFCYMLHRVAENPKMQQRWSGIRCSIFLKKYNNNNNNNYWFLTCPRIGNFCSPGNKSHMVTNQISTLSESSKERKKLELKAISQKLRCFGHLTFYKTWCRQQWTYTCTQSLLHLGKSTTPINSLTCIHLLKDYSLH
jgi:hypothetical protein